MLRPSNKGSRATIAELLGFKISSQEIIESKSAEPPLVKDLKIEEPNSEQKKEEEADNSYVVPENRVGRLPGAQYDQSSSPVASEIKFISQDSVPLNIGVTSLSRPNVGDSSSKPVLESLLNKNSSRSVILTILATISQEGDVDFNRIIDTLCKNSIVKDLPRLNLATLRRGVQLLVDVGESMGPYKRDQIYLQSEIRRIIGKENTSVFRFVGTPLKGVKTGFQLEFSNYTAPRPGTPILLLTDLGIGQPPFSKDPANVGEWIEFINTIKRNKCPLIALVPYRNNRWPIQLKPLLHIIYWDRSTRLLEVRRQIGSGHIVSK